MRAKRFEPGASYEIGIIWNSDKNVHSLPNRVIELQVECEKGQECEKVTGRHISGPTISFEAVS
jgi:hypothetical protein